METLSIVLLATVLILDKIIGYFKTRGVDLVKMSRVCDDVDFRAWDIRDKQLYDWHNHEDPDQPGVKVWWNQKYIVDIIKTLDKTLERQTLLMEQQVQLLSKMDKKLDQRVN